MGFTFWKKSTGWKSSKIAKVQKRREQINVVLFLDPMGSLVSTLLLSESKVRYCKIVNV